MSWRAPVMALPGVIAVGIGYVYLPYVGWSNSDSDARVRVEAYLAAVVGGSEDRGWNLLVPSGRDAYGSEDAYRQLMRQADWSDFAWELVYNGVCDDGVCSYILRLPSGRTSAPDVAWSQGPGNPGVLTSTRGATDLGEAFIGVRQRGWFGGIGVEVFGVRDSSQ